MIKATITLLLLLVGSTAFGQALDSLEADFANVAQNSRLDEEDLSQFFQKYATLLLPPDDASRFIVRLTGGTPEDYPLADFKHEPVYQNNIGHLIASNNPYRRTLAYLAITATGDHTLEGTLLEKLKTETFEGNLRWIGTALLHLGSDHTTPLFDFLVEHENFGDAHMLPLYFQLNPDSLQQTAYQRIRSENATARVLAAQILSKTTLNARTEYLLKEAVREWDTDRKGYAIYPIKKLQIGNLLPILEPLLDSSLTRNIALEALADSPTENDRQYVIDLIAQQDTVSTALLDCLFRSKRTENIRHWLELLYRKPLPEKYVFFSSDQPLLSSDSLLASAHTALDSIRHPSILGALVKTLTGRTDQESVKRMLALLRHGDEGVRYWTAESLTGNPSPPLRRALPGLLSDSATRTTALVTVAIQDELDTLQPLFESIYHHSPNDDWKLSALEYLSAFPKARHRDLFRTMLREEESITRMRLAALGLGRLHDEESVDLIAAAGEQERINSDLNARAYLTALGMIKGARAKAAVMRYQNSDEPVIRARATSLLDNW